MILGVFFVLIALASGLPTNDVRSALAGNCKIPLEQLENLKQILDDFAERGVGDANAVDQKARELTEKVNGLEYDARPYECQQVLETSREKIIELIEKQRILKRVQGTIEEIREQRNYYTAEEKKLAKQIREYKKARNDEEDDAQNLIDENPGNVNKIIAEKISKREIKTAANLFNENSADVKLVVNEAYSPDSIEFITYFINEISEEKRSTGIKQLAEQVKNSGQTDNPGVIFLDYFATKFVEEKEELKVIRGSIAPGVQAKLATLAQDIREEPPRSLKQYGAFYPGFFDLYIEDLVSIIATNADSTKLHEIINFTKNLTPSQQARALVQLYRSANLSDKNDKPGFSLMPRLIFLIGKLKSRSLDDVAADKVDRVVYEMKNSYLYAPSGVCRWGVRIGKGRHALLSHTNQWNSVGKKIAYNIPGTWVDGVQFNFDWGLESDNLGKDFILRNNYQSDILTVKGETLAAVYMRDKDDDARWIVYGKSPKIKDSGKYFLAILYNPKNNVYLLPSNPQEEPKVFRGDVDFNDINNYWKLMVSWEEYDD